MKTGKKVLTPKDEKLLYFYASIDAPYYFLPENIVMWLESGGLEKLEEEKPTIARWIKEMRRDLQFPKYLGFTTVFTREVESEMRKRGCIKENDYIRPSEVYNLIRYRYNPFFTKSKRTICLAETIHYLLDKLSKENPDKEEIKELAKIVKNWIQINKKIRGEK